MDQWIEQNMKTTHIWHMCSVYVCIYIYIHIGIINVHMGMLRWVKSLLNEIAFQTLQGTSMTEFLTEW